MSEKVAAIENKTSWYKDLSDQVADNMHIIHEYFDKQFTRSVIKKVISRLDECYFRSKFVGFEHFPKRNNPEVPLLFASNHSGMAFPWDGIILAAGIYEMFDYGPDSVRPLASPMLSESVLMNPYLHANLWKIVGSVDASFLNFETMMHQSEHNLLIYPEGVPGIGKGFNRRYQLQRFSSSFITMSLKYKTDIVPIFTVNGEYINPYAYRSKLLNSLVNKIGVPFLPVGFITLLIPFQPWIFYMGFPARLTYVMGKPIKAYEMTDKTIDQLSYDELVNIKDKVQDEMQAQLTEAVRKYGKQPYQLRQFMSLTFRKFRRLPYSMPFGWPLLFEHFKLQWKKNKNIDQPLNLGLLSSVKVILKSPQILFFYLPILGWIPLLMKGLKKNGRK